MKFLSSELIVKTGVENVGELIGTVSISVGGIPVNDANHVIDVGEATSVDIIIGTDLHTVEITETSENDMSEGLTALRAEEAAAIEAAEAEEVTE